MAGWLYANVVPAPAPHKPHRTQPARPDRERPLRAVLVANKTDLPPQRQQVRTEMAAEWAANNQLEFFEVAAVSTVGAGKQGR